MSKQKENALEDYAKLIYNSWTFDRMTEAEQKRLDELLFNSVPVREALKGTYKQRWEILCAIYDAYLIGIGYDGWEWREPKEEDLHAIRNRHLQKITEPHPFIGHPHY